MSKSHEIQGAIHSMGDTTEYGANGFTKREFVIRLSGEGENPTYPNYIALELIKDKCSLIDGMTAGTEIVAHCNLSGRLWTSKENVEKCFNSLQVWRIEGANANASPDAMNQDNGAPEWTESDIPADDIPF